MIYLYILQERLLVGFLTEVIRKHLPTKTNYNLMTIFIALGDTPTSELNTFSKSCEITLYKIIRFCTSFIYKELIHAHNNNSFVYSFQQDAFINRKVKETRRRSRMSNAISSNSANILQTLKKSSRKLIEKQSNDLVKPISNLLSEVR